MFVFIDESGDVCNWDLKSKSYSQYFVLAGLVVSTRNEKKHLARLIKRKLLEINEARNKPFEELKFSKFPSALRLSVLDALSKLDFSVYSVIVNKQTVNSELFKSSEVACYSWLSKMLFKQFREDLSKGIVLFNDRRYYAKNKLIFNRSVRNTVKNIYSNTELKIHHHDSKRNYGLQAVDFVAGAIRSNYILGVDKYFKYIRDKTSVVPLYKYRKWNRSKTT